MIPFKGGNGNLGKVQPLQNSCYKWLLYQRILYSQMGGRVKKKLKKEWKWNEECCPLQGGEMALRGPCRKQTQSLKSRCIRNRREIVLQLLLSVTKLYVSNSNCLSYRAFDNLLISRNRSVKFTDESPEILRWENGECAGLYYSAWSLVPPSFYTSSFLDFSLIPLHHPDSLWAVVSSAMAVRTLGC